MDRRRFISGLGVIGISSLAGCSGDDSDSEQEPANQPELEPSPEYTVEVNLPEEVDTREVDVLDVDPTVRRTLNSAYAEDNNVEREVTLDSDQFTLEVYQARKHLADRYPVSFFREHDILYQEFDSPALDSSELIPGQIELGLTVRITDEEYGADAEKQRAQDIEVEASQEQIRNRLFLDNDQLWNKLRKSDDPISFKNRSLSRGEWKEAAKEVEQNEKVQKELEEENIRSAYQRAAARWNRHAAGILDGRGGTSGQAGYLARTMEHVFDDTHAFILNDSDHFTVLAHNQDQDKLYLVDSVGLGDTEHPPKTHPVIDEYNTPLSNRKEGDDKLPKRTERTLRNSARLSFQVPPRASNNDNDFRNMFTDAEFRNSSALELREGKNLDEMFGFHRRWGLSAELSPSYDFTAKGDVKEDPDIVIT